MLQGGRRIAQGLRSPAKARLANSWQGLGDARPVSKIRNYASVNYFREYDSKLVLADGTEFPGYSFGAQKSVAGEAVFTTGMVGYPESLTDPSYRGEILTLTYPIIGSYGVPDRSVKDHNGLASYMESKRIHVSGFVVAENVDKWSHWNGQTSLSDWLKAEGIPAIEGVDTRQLTKLLRQKGSMPGKIVIGDQDISFDTSKQDRNLVAEVSVKEPFTVGSGDLKVVCIDCGVKNNIIRRLAQPGVEVTVVPWNYDLRKINFDGLFISNGPGNPETVHETIANVRWAMTLGKPIFGICMGNQVLSLAAGARVYKMKFGNRGQNQSVFDTTTGKTYITPQNHGYAVDNDTLPSRWKPYFVNTNDGTNEGIYHTSLPFFSAQFHPEARGGPADTDFLFQKFLGLVADYKEGRIVEAVRPDTSKKLPNRVLMLGSGGLQIGQAGEFDYSGSQAIKALKELGVQSVLINPNIATVQTKKGLADRVYLTPVNEDTVRRIIDKEDVDGVLLSFGGQTALNTGVDLYNSGVFGATTTRVLGTSVQSIKKTEDRELFKQALLEIGEKLAVSESTTDVQSTLDAAARIGYPVIIRSAYSLGGLGSGFAYNPTELAELASKAFASSPQVLVEKSLKGWKECEYEVVRDMDDNCLTVCNMENFDPMGIHTGESIVVAPSQTLSNDEYHMLRTTSIKVVRHLGIVGECNIQYALDPNSQDYCIIEVNPRLSRSSALASKATGYPLAYVGAKLSLGQRMSNIRNSITKVTSASFEPSLDYIVTKIPRWDLSKFTQVSRLIGSAMKSVGEVMAVGRNFEESIQKALRMVDGSYLGFDEVKGLFVGREAIIKELENPTDKRIFAIAAAFNEGFSVDEVHHHTRITPWFLSKLHNIHNLRGDIKKHSLDSISQAQLRYAKQLGFSDKQIASYLQPNKKNQKPNDLDVRAKRKKLGVVPFVKQIDTVAAEFPAQTNYLYVTYSATESDLPKDRDGVMVLGSGVYRIGSSVEFDYCGVTALRTLRKLGYKTVMVNYNPETVSTDYDESDRLYFEELSLERTLDIYDIENPQGVIVSCGGQQPQNLALPLQKNGVPILGTDALKIDMCEDRHKYSQLLDSIGVAQPDWQELRSVDDAFAFAKRVSYPVLVRPSYVLSGAAMNVAHNDDELRFFLNDAADVSPEHPVVISKFLLGAKELEVDAVCQNGKFVNWAVSEHVENAGVHSGDATMVLPAHTINEATRQALIETTKKITGALNVNGPCNTQYLVRPRPGAGPEEAHEILVIETNLRASRSFPFVSKVYDIDFVENATKVFVGRTVEPDTRCDDKLNHWGVKAAQFSFKRLMGADPVLGVEMASTGEVACFGRTVNEAFLKSVVAAGFKVPPNNKKTLLVSGDLPDYLLRDIPRLQSIGYTVYSTPALSEKLADLGVKHFPLSYDAAIRKIRDRDVSLVWDNAKRGEDKKEYEVRRSAVDFSAQLTTNPELCHQLISALSEWDNRELPIEAWDEYHPQ
jgi:carbamoyl-phosphate synthase large subunit/carbamoyl-phosphate synthase small subunit